MSIPFLPPSFKDEPASYYGVRNGSIQLVQGQSWITFKFSVNSLQQLPMSGPNWFERSMRVRNTVDNPPQQNITVGMITYFDADTCTVQLNAQPDTNNYFLYFVCDQSSPY